MLITACCFFLLLSLSYGAPVTGADADLIVQKHNRERRLYGSPDIRWSDALARSASSSDANPCTSDHSDDEGVGENLAMAYDSRKTFKASELIDSWIREKDYWNCNKPTGGGNCQSGKKCGHYTQMVWKSTTQVGCALRQCSKGQGVVCQYKAEGNIRGQLAVSSCGGSSNEGRTPSPPSRTPSPPSRTPSPPSNSGGSCKDSIPSGATFKDDGSRITSCAEVKERGGCKSAVEHDFCLKTCGGCTSRSSNNAGCKDSIPSGATFKDETGSRITSCAEVKERGGCKSAVEHDFCLRTCGGCALNAEEASAVEEDDIEESTEEQGNTVDTSPSTPGWAIGLLVLGTLAFILLIVAVAIQLSRR